MKNKIEQLLNGKFEYEVPGLLMAPEELQLQMIPGQAVKGTFTLASKDGRKFDGFIYSSNPRVRCEPVEFHGIRNEIRFQADGNGFPEGTEETGFFTICCELGEYKLPFTLMRAKEAESVKDKEKKEAWEDLAAEAPVSDLLAETAQEDFQQAYRMFLNPHFAKALENEKEKYSWYEALGGCGFSYQTLEEFLCRFHYKEAIQLTVDRTEIQLQDLNESVAETVQLMKSSWGFQKITLESDAAFVRPEKKIITTDEFIGSTFDLKLVIDPKKMHAGKNYGRVTLWTPYQMLRIEVCAEREKTAKKAEVNRICKKYQKKLEEYYLDFRLKKIDLETWAENSINVVGCYHRAGGQDPFSDLFLVQLYFASGKQQRALNLLEALEKQKNRFKTAESYGFYRYLTTFFYQDAAYVDQAEEEIQMLFYKDKTNWKLQWILFYMQESFLRDGAARYEAASEQFRYGCHSRILYYEAYQALCENPFRMRHLGLFELQVLRFAAKENVLTPELIRHTAVLAAHYGKYSWQLLEILKKAYEIEPSAEVAKAICMQMMKGERRDAEAFQWYAKGVEYELRITGLYEYYMESVSDLNLAAMPQIIRMYFAYDTTLDYRRRAAIYRNMIERQEEDPQTYRTYRAAMEKFAVDQLEMGRMTEDLGVIYRTFIRQSSLSKNMTDQLTRLLFTYEFTCTSPRIRTLTVHSMHLEREYSAVFSDGSCTIAVYDPDSILIAEDADGVRYPAELFCYGRRVFELGSEASGSCGDVGGQEDARFTAAEAKCSAAEDAADSSEGKAAGADGTCLAGERNAAKEKSRYVIDEKEMLRWCMKPEHAGIALFVCVTSLTESRIDAKMLPFLVRGCSENEFSESFRRELRKEVLHYYMNHVREESLSEFLKQMDYLDYVKVDKSALITLLAEEGMCTDAFSLLDVYGFEGIPLLQLVRICSRMVLELEFAENTMLLYLCHFCFESGKYDDKLLRYLLLYYEGSIDEMKRLWEAAVGFELDTMILEEKIMMMLLFTGCGTQGSEVIFESYVKKLGRRKLRTAYLNLRAYEYFVKGMAVGECVFRYLEKEYAYWREHHRLDEQEEVCRLALMQYYAGQVALSERQRTYVAEMLEEFSTKGMRFAFWLRFDEDLLRPYQMEGHVFAEYVCNPSHTVTISFRPAGSAEEYRKETMKNCFEGVFVREFTLFYGDELECYLEEECQGELKRTDKRILTPGIGKQDGQTRYELINRIIQAEKEDPKKAEQEMENYLQLDYVTKELFTLQ